MSPSQDLALRNNDDLVARVAAGTMSEAERVLVRRLVRLRQGQQPPNHEELALMLGEANRMDLDPFAGQCYFIDLGAGWVCHPHWSGLVKIAEDTGQYEGHDGPWFSDDGEHWKEAWPGAKAPSFAKVIVYRKGHRPTTAVAKLARSQRPGTAWSTNPEDMLAKCALRMALKRAFPKEADRSLSGPQLKALHTLAGLRGLDDRTKRLEAASDILGRKVDSFTELSVAEASEIHEAWAEEPIEAEVIDSGPAYEGDPFAGLRGVEVGEDRGTVAVPERPAELGETDIPPGSNDAPAGGDPSGEGDTPPPAATEPEPEVSPEELATLRNTAAQTLRDCRVKDSKRWGPWFRAACDSVAGPGGFESFPGRWTAPQLKELMRRVAKEDSL